MRYLDWLSHRPEILTDCTWVRFDRYRQIKWNMDMIDKIMFIFQHTEKGRGFDNDRLKDIPITLCTTDLNSFKADEYEVIEDLDKPIPSSRRMYMFGGVNDQLEDVVTILRRFFPQAQYFSCCLQPNKTDYSHEFYNSHDNRGEGIYIYDEDEKEIGWLKLEFNSIGYPGGFSINDFPLPDRVLRCQPDTFCSGQGDTTKCRSNHCPHVRYTTYGDVLANWFGFY